MRRDARLGDMTHGHPPILSRKLRNNKCNKFNKLYDTVMNDLDDIMKFYPIGDFENYTNRFEEGKNELICDLRPSKFRRTRQLRSYKHDRFAQMRKFMYQVIDHIRQSINILEQYHDIYKLRKEYERLLQNPYMLIKFYRERYKKPTVQTLLHEESQLDVVPILKPFIVKYIEKYGYASNTTIRPLPKLLTIDENTYDDANVCKFEL